MTLFMAYKKEIFLWDVGYKIIWNIQIVLVTKYSEQARVVQLVAHQLVVPEIWVKTAGLLDGFAIWQGCQIWCR